MPSPTALRAERTIENVAMAFAAVAIAIALWVLARYALHSWPPPTPRGAPANPAGVVLAVLLSLAVLARVRMNRRGGSAPVGVFFAGMALFFGALKIIGVLAHVDVVFDHVLFANQLEGPPANRMAFIAAITFVLLGSSLLLQFTERFSKIADLLAIGGFLFIFQGAVGYLFGELTLASFGWERAIAMHSLIAMALLALAVLLARPTKGLTAIFSDDGTAGVVARSLMPAAFVTPFVVGILFFSQPDPLHLARATIASAVAFCAILAVAIGKLVQIDRQRLKALRDISERSAKDRALMESIGDGVFAVDTQWRITLWNKGAERITGFAAAEAVGKPLREVLVIRDAKTRSENMGIIDRTLSLGKPLSLDGDNYIVAKDGREVPVGDSVAPVQSRDGKKAEGVIIVFRDVTVERQLAKLRQDFLFRTIHDLRAPANVINLLVQDFQVSKTDIKDHPDVVKGMQIITELNSRMRQLVEDLLEVAKGTDPAYRLRIASVEVAPLVKEIFAQHEKEAKARNIRLELQPSAGPVAVLADSSALTEVLENMVGNAIKYGKDGGLISVSLEVADGMCKVTVWDDGAGIAPEHIPKIFDPYFRVPDTGKPGTGLGLFIVRQLVEKMGGQVKCASEVGKWTAFSCTLPAAK